jgi:hypothetical protein
LISESNRVERALKDSFDRITDLLVLSPKKALMAFIFSSNMYISEHPVEVSSDTSSGKFKEKGLSAN